jgi:HK97 family phage portal protein
MNDIVFVNPRDPSSALSGVLRAARRQIQESRSSLENPQTPLSMPAEWLLDMFNGGRTDAGIRVSEMTALQVSTVFACVNLISGTIGSLPLNVYEHVVAKDQRAGKRLAFDHALFDILHDEPNEEMTALTFRKTLQSHALLWGNLYAEIQRDKGSRVVAIWPRNPARTRPIRRNNQLLYETTEGVDEVSDILGQYQEASARTILREDMIHIPGLTLDGRVGSSVIHLARQVVGLALAAEKFGSKLFANYGRPGGVLETANTLKPEARENLKKSWAEAQSGENANKIAVLEAGISWKDTATKPNEAQFLELRKFQKSEICSIFAVPPHMVGDTDKTNRANTEQIGLEFMNYSLSPWLTAWEQELKRKLFPTSGRSANKFFPMHDARRLMMPDAASRRDFYASGKQWGYLSTNDVREMENLNPSDDPQADLLWIPLNMGVSGADVDPADSGADNSGLRKWTKAYFRLFRDAFGRITARSDPDQEAFAKAFLPVLGTIAEQVYRAANPKAAISASRELELECFLVTYARGMRKRFDEWKSANGHADEIAERELKSAIQAIAAEAGRPAEPEKIQTEA